MEISDTVSVALAVDSGETGVVLDAREIFRKGYTPQSVDVSFDDPRYQTFNTTIEVDPVTTLAILTFDNSELTEAERLAFESGVVARLTVHDANNTTTLADTTEQSLVLDASGTLYRLRTAHPYLAPPIVLKPDVPYLLQSEDRADEGVLLWDPLGDDSQTPVIQGDAAQHASDRLSYHCPDGSVAIGHTGSTGSHIDHVRLRCAVVEPDGALGAVEETGTIGTSTGGVASTADCPGDGVLVRVEGHKTDWIDNVQGRCLGLDAIAMEADNSAATLAAPQFGGGPHGASVPYDVSCNDGSAVTGVLGSHDDRTGATNGRVIEIGYHCRAINLARWGVDAYLPDAPSQKTYFTEVAGAAEPNTFLVRQGTRGSSHWYWRMQDDTLLLESDLANAGEFVLEQDEDGWIRIRVPGPAYLVHGADGELVAVASQSAAVRFRLIAANIDWAVTDRGTFYHQPVTPPARLDFAYAATIRNCSPATLTETVGNAQTRSRTTEVSTSESLQLFSSTEKDIGVTVGVEVEGGIGPAKVKGSVEVSASFTSTTSETTGSVNTVDTSQTEEAEVSRARSLEVPPFTGVEVFDAVRTIENVHIPFTQVYRLSGTYEDTGTRLTGEEIVTQMLFNFVGGLPVGVAPEHVDVGIRGRMEIDQMFEAQTDVVHLETACN